MMFAGCVNRHQLSVIEYLQEENRVLKERLGVRRIRCTDAERRRLARKAKALGRRVLTQLETLVTPDTLAIGCCNLPDSVGVPGPSVVASASEAC